MRTSMLIALLIATFAGRQNAQTQSETTGLKQRTEIQASPKNPEQPDASGVWIVPAGTRMPIQLRQAISTKSAQPGDPIYAQTTFPIVVHNTLMIPGGTYVKGVVDSAKRAGRIKGRAELQFHLTTLIFENGYTLELAAAVDQVPGRSESHMKEPGTVAHDSEKGADLKRVGETAVTAGQIGSMAGAASGSIRGLGIGGLSGIAAGTLIGILARGSDVEFEIGSGVEVALNRAIGIDGEKVRRTGMLPASSTPAPVIPTTVRPAQGSK
jgi:hypothetical protein